MKVMIAGGGTGGHVYMGIALARELLRRDAASEFLFVGTRRGLEARVVPQEGFRLEFIVSAGLKRVGFVNMIRNSLIIPASLLQSRRLVLTFDPDAVVGVGGYSSGPVVLAGWWLARPTMIIEPNAYPGFTNRLLARVVRSAALAMPDAAEHFGHKGTVTGVPVRVQFHDLPRRERRAGLTLLVYGGSQGSHALNAIVCRALPDLKAFGPSLRLILQTGEKELEAVRQACREAGVAADVRAFLPRIYEELAQADLLLSRAGAGTVAEISAAGRAAILVPFPGAADDHQTKNARALEGRGAAKMIPESEWAPGRLAQEVRYFMDHPEDLDRMGDAARKLATPDATRRIADMVAELAAGRSRQPKAELG